MKFSAPCLLGLEKLVANDLRHMNIENVCAQNGRVLFSGGYDAMARANLCSRYAERILILIDEFEAFDFDTVFERVKKIEWQDYIPFKDAFPVKGSSVNSKLSSVPALQKIIKKAIASKLSEKYGEQWLDESGAIHQIQFFMFKNRLSVMIDTSGDGLHKRGYRENSNQAPIRETLAAAMVDLSHIRSNHIVCDPFCGSGTILIEAAMKAMNIAPGIYRNFAFENWSNIDGKFIKTERERSKDLEKRNVPFEAYGYDISSEAVELSIHNAKFAGVSDKVYVSIRDIEKFEDDFEFLSVVTNPPYGERMLDLKSAQQIYKIMGNKFLQKPHHSYTIISPDDEFEKLFGRAADKRRKLYNGMLKCNVYMYYK